MHITSAEFVKGVVEPDQLFSDDLPQVACIGRSNVGKSSLINTFTKRTNLARTSSFPGRTQQVNFFLINKSFYLVDLPGYGYAKMPEAEREKLRRLIEWYLFGTEYSQKKIILIIDAKVGPTEDDRLMLRRLEEHHKEVVIVANKADKIKKSQYDEQLKKLQSMVNGHTLIPFSSFDKRGVGELTVAVLS